MSKQDTFLDIVDEVIAEEMDVMTELMKEEIEPLVKFRKDLETKISSQAIAEMYRLETEATGRVLKEKAYTWLKR